MKYLHVSLWSPINNVGGFETVLKTTAAEQSKKGHKVFVIGRAEGETGEKEKDIDGVTYIEVLRPIKRCPSTLQVGIVGIAKLLLEIIYSYILLTPTIISLLQKERIDAVIFYGIHTFLISPICRAYGSVTLLGIEGIQKNPHPSKTSLLYWFRKCKYAVFTGIWTINKFFYLPDGTIIRNYELLQEYAGKEKVFFFPCGVDISEIEKTKEDKEFASLKERKKIKIIICPRRLVEEKGVRYLVNAIPKILDTYPKTHIVFTSDGILRKELELLVRKLKIDTHVTFTGPLPYKRVLRIMKTADIMVAPSSGEELFGMVFLEAYALKVAIVSTMFGGIPNVVHDKKTGLLVPPKNTDALAKTISNLLSNHKLHKKLTENGFALVKKEYELSNTVTNIDICVLALQKQN